MAAQDEVSQASEQFYAALNRTLDGDSSQMEQVWSHGSDVSAIHPFWGSNARMGGGWGFLGAGRASVLRRTSGPK